MYNTNNPIPSSALEDMADNAQTFDALVTKTEGTTTDRNGITRRVFQQILMDMGFQPLSGSFQTGAIVTARNQTLYDEVSQVFYAWGGTIPVGGYVVPAGSTPATSGGIGAGAWSDKTDLTLRAELSWAVAEYHLVNYNDINAILTVTTGPVVIRAPIGRWASPTTWRDGVTILGERMPVRSADGTKLDNGTVFEGSVFIIAKHVGCIKNCGFDCGSYVVSLGKTAGDGLVVSNSPPTELTSTHNPILGWDVDNVSGLVASAGDLFHGVLLEGMSDSVIGTIVGYNGIASVVVKNKKTVCGNLIGYDGTPYAVVVKSNKYAPIDGGLQINNVLAVGGGGFHIVSDDPTDVGSALSGVKIGNVDVIGGTGGFKIHATTAQPASDITIDSLSVKGVAGVAAEVGLGASRVKIGKHNIYGCANGFSIQDGADIDIGDGDSNGNTVFGYIVTSPNAKAGKIKAAYNGSGGTYITTRYFNIDSYTGTDAHGGTYRPNELKITEFLSGITSTSGTVAVPILHRRHSGGIVEISGEITRSCSVNDVLLTLTTDITPFYTQYASVTVYDGTNFDTKPVVINTSGEVRSMFAITSGTIYLSPLKYNCL